MFLLFLFSTFELGATEFVTDIENIKRELDHSILRLHLRDPSKNPIPGASFGSFLSDNSQSSLVDHCLEFDSRKINVEVLMILRNFFPKTLPPLAPEAKKKEDLNEEMIIFLVENSQPIDHDETLPPAYEVALPSEFMEDKIKFAHKSLQFNYSTGYRMNQNSPSQGRELNPNDLEWIRRGDLKIDLLPSLKIASQVLVSESLQTQNGPIRGNVISSLFSLQGIKFETNYVSVKVDASAQVTQRAKVNLSFNVDHQGGESSAQLLSNVDFSIPNGSRLMVFSNVKSPLRIYGSVLDSSADAGIEFKTSKGLRLSGEVNQLGTGVPQVRGTILL